MRLHKKICFISAGLAGGGMERALTNLANYFAKEGHNVSIINLFITEQFYDIDKNIKVYWPLIERKKYHRLIYAIRIIPYLRKNINLIKPNAIISFGEWFNPFVILATRFMNMPVYISDRMGPQLNLGYLLETSKKV